MILYISRVSFFRFENDVWSLKEPLLPPSEVVRGRHASHLHELSSLQRTWHRVLRVCEHTREILQTEDAGCQVNRLNDWPAAWKQKTAISKLYEYTNPVWQVSTDLCGTELLGLDYSLTSYWILACLWSFLYISMEDLLIFGLLANHKKIAQYSTAAVIVTNWLNPLQRDFLLLLQNDYVFVSSFFSQSLFIYVYVFVSIEF